MWATRMPMWGERNQAREDDSLRKGRELLNPTFAENAKVGHPECRCGESEIKPEKTIVCERRRELLSPTFAENAKVRHPNAKVGGEIKLAKMISLRKSGVS